MAGKSSKLGASSSASTKTVKQEEKRKRCATRAEEAKKPRPFQLINVTAHPRGSGSGTAVPVPVPVVAPPLHCAASNNMATAAAFPFPMAGVNGAAPLWSTAAALGAASRAAALTLSSLPATASADGPAAAPCVLALAPAPGLQPPPGAAAAASTAAATAAALALPVASATTGVIRPPLVLAQQAGAEGQLVPLPLHFVSYYHHYTTGGVVSGLLPAPAVGIPLAAALGNIENGALGRMLSALTPACHPPLRQHQSKKSGSPPPWWPTGSEDWWVPELLAHLDTVAALMMHHAPPPVPFVPSYSLRKAQRVALLVAIVKHLAPDFARIAAAVRQSGKLSVSETDLWHSALNNERAKWMRPVFVLLPQPEQEQQQQQQGGGGGSGGTGTPSGAATGSVVVPSGSAASDSCEQVAIANLPAGACASVSAAPAADGSRGEVTAAAELVVEKEPQRSDGDGGGVVSADDAPAGDGRGQRPAVNFPAGDGSEHNKQGAAVAAAAPTGHVRQVVEGGAPEMTTMQPEQEQHGGVPGDDDATAAAENDQAEVHPVVDVEEGHQWWLNSEELNRMFAELESFGDDVWY